MKMRAIERRVCLVVACLSATACASGEFPDDGPVVNTFGGDGSGGVGETDTDGETEGVFEEGTWWCTRAATAEYVAPNGVFGNAVTYPEGDRPEGCDCAPEEVHEWLFARLVGNEVTVDPAMFGPLPDDVLNFRNNVYQATENECTNLVPGAALSSNCNDGQVGGGALDVSPLTGFQHPGLYQGTRGGELTCSFTRMHVAPPSCSFVDGSYGIRSSQSGYTVPQSTFDDFFDHPGCLLAEGGRVDATPTGYAFVGINRRTLLWELGLRTGDVPLSIDGMPLQTVDDAFAAYEALRDQQQWSLKVTRGSSIVTLNYEVQ